MDSEQAAQAAAKASGGPDWRLDLNLSKGEIALPVLCRSMTRRADGFHPLEK